MPSAKENLTRYKQKRNFTITSEPEAIPAAQGGHHYLIQKHAASHLHYDFRLELDGTLKSWAVPKGPSLDPHDRRLAMMVEDHPVAYGSFEGTIPKGQYGGGTVMLWDTGTWEPVGDPHKGLKKGKLVFTLHGKRLHGEWTLVKTHGRMDKRGNSWLLIKHRDKEVREGDNEAFLAKNNTSVKSGRSMEEIAANKRGRVWQSNRAGKTTEAKPIDRPASVKAKAKKLPGFIRPQLATLTTAMPKGKDWVHEVKFDGYRMLSYLENGDVTIYSRNGKDWTRIFPPLVRLLKRFKVDNAILDGEVIVTDAQGRSNFSEMKDALSNGETERFQYYLFDLLFLNGQDTTSLPLLERKALLAGLIKKNAPQAPSQRIFLSEHFAGADDNFLRRICDLHLEGVISKRAEAPYEPGRGKIWLKIKCQKRQEFVIGGFTLPSNGGLGVGALLLGYYDGGTFTYAGRVGTGFTNASSMEIRKKLEKIRTQEKPYATISTDGRRGAIWVRPELVGEVEFTEWTPDGRLRHPSFKGLREDKPPKDIIREVAVPARTAEKEAEVEVKQIAKPQKNTSYSGQSKADKHTVTVGNIRISHPGRVIYSEGAITKQQLAEYYLSVADRIVPHIAHRPLSMVRCPEGSEEECFFQRHIGNGNIPHLYEVPIIVKGEKRHYLTIKDTDGLISLAQWGVIELHSWQCRDKNPMKPDQIVFDLDPDPEVPFTRLAEAARDVRERMSELGLKSFLKTTGGKGLHVVIPLTPAYDFPTIKAFARAIAVSMAKDNPSRYIATMSKEKRKGKIFIDYLRNDITATAVAPYSARARAGAPVSMPLGWEELKPSLTLSSFTIRTAPERLARLKADPWADFLRTKQKVAVRHLKALRIDYKE